MRERWARLQELYLELAIRERIMVMCALLVALFGAMDALVLHPMDLDREMLKSRLSQSVASIEALDERAKQLSNQIAGRTPIRLDREERALTRQIAIMQADIEERMSSMIAPSDVTRMLEELLGKESDLTLIKLMTTSPATFPAEAGGNEDGTAATQRKKAEFYRHGFVIELEGSYLATLHYLESIESLPWDLSWDRITYTVIEYPRARISIHLHTLSREENWIGV